MSDERTPEQSPAISELTALLAEAGVNATAADFMQALRHQLAERVAPRAVVPLVRQLVAAGRPVDVDTVLELMAATSGDASMRQSRNMDAWRALGAGLTMQGQDGSPDGQREFIGAARAVPGKPVSDALLLQIALVFFDMGRRLNAELVGLVARDLQRVTRDDHPTDIRVETVAPSIRRVVRRRRRDGAADRRESEGLRPQRQARMLRPGTRFGRKTPRLRRGRSED